MAWVDRLYFSSRSFQDVAFVLFFRIDGKERRTDRSGGEFYAGVDASDTTDLEIVLESDNCRAEQMLSMQEQLLDRMQQFHDKIL